VPVCRRYPRSPVVPVVAGRSSHVAAPDPGGLAVQRVDPGPGRRGPRGEWALWFWYQGGCRNFPVPGSRDTRTVVPVRRAVDGESRSRDEAHSREPQQQAGGARRAPGTAQASRPRTGRTRRARAAAARQATTGQPPAGIVRGGCQVARRSSWNAFSVRGSGGEPPVPRSHRRSGTARTTVKPITSGCCRSPGEERRGPGRLVGTPAGHRFSVISMGLRVNVRRTRSSVEGLCCGSARGRDSPPFPPPRRYLSPGVQGRAGETGETGRMMLGAPRPDHVRGAAPG